MSARQILVGRYYRIDQTFSVRNYTASIGGSRVARDFQMDVNGHKRTYGGPWTVGLWQRIGPLGDSSHQNDREHEWSAGMMSLVATGGLIFGGDTSGHFLALDRTTARCCGK